MASGDVSLLRQQRFDDLQQQMIPELQTPETVDSLRAMAAMFPGTAETHPLVVVGENTLKNGDERTTDVTLEYNFGSKWLLANVVTQEAGGKRRITGFSVTPLTESLEDRNRFTLHGKSELEYDTLILAIVSILISVYASVLCLRTKGLRRKWLWLIGTLAGFVGYGVNWTTGESAFMPLMFRLPPAGASATLYGPWTMFVTLPVGALAFLFLRKRLPRVS